jgi:four helix bundle protein
MAKPNNNVKDLIAWQKGTVLALSVYRETKDWPRHEMYGLTSQVRRAAVSVPSNIAERQGRATTREFLHHLSISYGSLMETFTQLYIASKLSYLSAKQATTMFDQIDEEARILNGLSASLRKRGTRDRHHEPLTTNH